ncbi:MAG: TldD/PmbA family protein [Candidatus Bathyarchaeia archaeon]
MELDWILSEGEKLGLDDLSLIYHESAFEIFSVDNRNIREAFRSGVKGLGIRLVYKGGFGFSATNILDRDSVYKCLERALAIARAVQPQSKAKLAEVETVKDKAHSKFEENPLEVDFEEKVRVVLEANRAAFNDPRVKSAFTRLGVMYDRRVIKSTTGVDVEVKSFTTGVSHVSVAYESGVMERVAHQKSMVSGWEFIERNDWTEFTSDLSNLVCKALYCKTPPPGSYTVVVDPEVVGLLLHEAFGHASEGDLVYSGGSILRNRLGTKVASDYVTIVDEGVVEGGYFIPYDDEGVPKRRTLVVENGVLKRFLTSRRAAAELSTTLTGNGRCQDFENIPIVRQTNFYMLPGDAKFEELLEGVDYGIYIKGKGSTGGEVDPGMGTFTFSVGPSHMIRKGEVGEMVRGVVISGFILDVLRDVDCVSSDLHISTSVFGGCGKSAQTVKVGDGGPHIRVKRMIVGGG